MRANAARLGRQARDDGGSSVEQGRFGRRHRASGMRQGRSRVTSPAASVAQHQQATALTHQLYGRIECVRRPTGGLLPVALTFSTALQASLYRRSSRDTHICQCHVEQEPCRAFVLLRRSGSKSDARYSMSSLAEQNGTPTARLQLTDDLAIRFRIAKSPNYKRTRSDRIDRYAPLRKRTTDDWRSPSSRAKIRLARQWLLVSTEHAP